MDNEKLDIKELEKLRYAAMTKTYYDMHIELDKSMINWSTLALAGLIAIGYRGDVPYPVLWLLCVIAFFIALALIRKSVETSARVHHRYCCNFGHFLDNLYPATVEDAKTNEINSELEDQIVRKHNRWAKVAFYSAVLLSVLFVVLSVFC